MDPQTEGGRPSCPHNIKQDKTDRLRRGAEKEPVYYHSYLQLKLSDLTARYRVT